MRIYREGKRDSKRIFEGYKEFNAEKEKKLSRDLKQALCVVRDLTNNKVEQRRRHCSAISLTVVMLCVCTKIRCVCDNELVCKAVRLAFLPDQRHFPYLYSYSVVIRGGQGGSSLKERAGSMPPEKLSGFHCKGYPKRIKIYYLLMT